MNSPSRIRITAEELTAQAAVPPEAPESSSQRWRIRSSDLMDNPPRAPGATLPAPAPRGHSTRAAPARTLLLAVGLGFALCLLLLSLSGRWYGPQPHCLEHLDQASGTSIVRIEIPGSLGTGFVVASSGNRHLLLTNRHVIVGQSPVIPVECRVVLRSGAQLTGRVVAVAKAELDLALIEVVATGLRPLGKLAAFSRVRVGEPVAAAGHPLGLNYSLTEGIISSKRNGLILQTTAAINPGNSGGPLVNGRGEIVGVNTWTLTTAQGIGLAIRSDLTRDPSTWLFQDGFSTLPIPIP